MFILTLQRFPVNSKKQISNSYVTLSVNKIFTPDRITLVPIRLT